MTGTSEPLPIFCFSDILCVFAYAANARLEQLRADFGEQIQLSEHFISVYGDVPRRIERHGQSGAEYGANVVNIAERFDHIEVHPDVFCDSYPVSSLPAHHYLRAVKLLEDEGVFDAAFVPMTWDVRVAFFRDLVDISKRENLDAIAEQHDIPVDAVNRHIESGRAYAELDHDVRLQREYDVQVSPSLIMNEGRQRLNGNVGYRVIEANVNELLRKPDDEMSQC